MCAGRECGSHSKRKMACCLVKFRVGPSAQTVALYEDILPEELSEILKATLPILGDILGVQDEVVFIFFSLL
jgi:hypothetical protein